MGTVLYFCMCTKIRAAYRHTHVYILACQVAYVTRTRSYVPHVQMVIRLAALLELSSSISFSHCVYVCVYVCACKVGSDQALLSQRGLCFADGWGEAHAETQ